MRLAEDGACKLGLPGPHVVAEYDEAEQSLSSDGGHSVALDVVATVGFCTPCTTPQTKLAATFFVLELALPSTNAPGNGQGSQAAGLCNCQGCGIHQVLHIPHLG